MLIQPPTRLFRCEMCVLQGLHFHDILITPQLLREFRDLMMSNALEEGEECPICFEGLQIGQSMRYLFSSRFLACLLINKP